MVEEKKKPKSLRQKWNYFGEQVEKLASKPEKYVENVKESVSASGKGGKVVKVKGFTGVRKPRGGLSGLYGGIGLKADKDAVKAVMATKLSKVTIL